MEVMISVCGETPHIGEVFHCGDAYATVVSVDTKGNPVELPFELTPDSPADKLRCAGAADRREVAAISSGMLPGSPEQDNRSDGKTSLMTLAMEV